MINVLKKRISAARKKIPSDLVLRNGKVINVFLGEIQEKDVAVCEGVIVGVGSDYHGKNEVDLKGKIVAPGLIDGHLHIESSMLTPYNLAAALLVHGTTTIVSDPHEIANVMGLDGVRFMLKESRSIPFDIFFMVPSCVPATSLETGGAILKASDLSELKNEPRILGLAEMMNFPGVLMGEEELLDKIVLFRTQVLDGHCPELRDYDLQAYLTAGMRSDHETSDRLEGLEKVESGMMLMIREGSSAKNLEELLPLVNNRNLPRFCFVSDDLGAEDIQQKGHLDSIVRKAVQLGMDPVSAVQMVTLNPAVHFGLKDRGAVAPGYSADLMVLDNLENFEVDSVYKNGQMVVDSGVLVNFPIKQKETSLMQSRLLNIAPLSPENFRIYHPGGKARVIELISGQIITRMLYKEAKSEGGLVSSDVESDVLKLSVVERHEASGRVALGLVHGFGLRKGAIASSVAHDSHNVIVVGVSDEEIFKAVEVVRLMGGGLAVVCGNETLAKTPLEIAGLMSNQPLGSLVKQLRTVKNAAFHIGCVPKEPFIALSFLALPVIPELRLTDRGLVDVNRFEIVPLFLESE